MAELNEYQLGLINSLIYLNVEYTPGQSISDLVAQARIPGALEQMSLGGGLTVESAKQLLDDISGIPEVMSLKIHDSINTDIRGICFTDPKTDEALIAFRGTGPKYAAWDDNCQGGYLSDTDMQEEALAFAKKCAEDFDSFTVTGHSKGGNLAQYLTVVMGDQVDRCVSFDGQGFGDEFLKKYAKEIAKNRDKIRNICAYNDYVNGLLFSIAGETIYLHNDEEGKGGHYIYSMIAHEENKINGSGEYETNCEQCTGLKIINLALDSLVIATDAGGDSNREFLIYTLVGMLLGGVMGTEDKSWKDIIKHLIENTIDYVDIFNIDKLIRRASPSPVKFRVDTVALRHCGERLNTLARQIDGIQQNVEQIRKKMDKNLIDGIAIGLPLRGALSQLEKESNKLEKLSRGLYACADLYDTDEKQAAAFAG